MKTAEEILKEHGWDVKYSPLTPMVMSFMKEYAEQACEEQRKICSYTYSDVNLVLRTRNETCDIIMNAPKPELK